MAASRLRPWIILILLWAAYFHPLLIQPSGTLAFDYSDFLAEHLPARVFLVREWRTTGELPLWNPFHFCGAPFVHDIQVGTFYPPYAATLLAHESNAGAIMSWVFALHVLAAGAFTLLYARSRGLGEAGSLVAAIGYAFSAKWMTHLLLAGHTITVGLAWLPLVLMALESFTRTGRCRSLIGGGLAFALLVLGTHPQWTFYAGLFIALWTFPTLNRGRWLAGGVAIVLLAILLAAVQLLPTWEASRYSSRAAGMAANQNLVLGFNALISLVGPSPVYFPALSWELRGIFGVVILAAAMVAPVLDRSFTWSRTVLLGLMAYSFGGSVLLDSLPGFSLFRAAPRMLLIATFPIAILAGATADRLLRDGWTADQRRALRRAVLLVVLLAALPSLTAALLHLTNAGSPPWAEFVLFWTATALGLAAVGAACLVPSLSTRWRTGLLLAALLLELVTPTLRFMSVKPQAEIDPESDLVKFLKSHAPPSEARVIDIEFGSLPTDRFAPLGIGTPQALSHGIASPRGYNPLDVRHYREYLNFVMGIDENVRALTPVTQPIVPNFPRNVPALWNLLNVRYLVCFDDYRDNPLFRDDSGHRLTADDWKLATLIPAPPAVPALPPIRPDPLPRALVFLNRHAESHARAFVVPNAIPLPPGREFETLIATDLRQTVAITGEFPPTPAGGAYRPLHIREYGANRVVIDLKGGEGGWLVLADVWFPGWTCQIDGVNLPVQRANHAFRAVPIPPGAQVAEFRFEPRLYHVGWWISAATLAALIPLLFLTRTSRNTSRSKERTDHTVQENVPDSKSESATDIGIDGKTP